MQTVFQSPYYRNVFNMNIWVGLNENPAALKTVQVKTAMPDEKKISRPLALHSRSFPLSTAFIHLKRSRKTIVADGAAWRTPSFKCKYLIYLSPCTSYLRKSYFYRYTLQVSYIHTCMHF